MGYSLLFAISSREELSKKDKKDRSIIYLQKYVP